MRFGVSLKSFSRTFTECYSNRQSRDLVTNQQVEELKKCVDYLVGALEKVELRMSRLEEKCAKPPERVALGIELDCFDGEEPDWKALESEVRSIAMDGLTWGHSGVGPKVWCPEKQELQIVCFLEQDKVCFLEVRDKVLDIAGSAFTRIKTARYPNDFF